MAFNGQDLATGLLDLYANPLKPGGSPSGAEQSPNGAPPLALGQQGNPLAMWLQSLSPPDQGGSTALPPPYGGNQTPTPPGQPKPNAGGANPNGFMENMANAEAPPAWMAKAALAAMANGTLAKYRDHLMSDPVLAANPHIRNWINGMVAGSQDRIAEAQHYSNVYGVPGVDYPIGAGDGIPNDGR